jgi:uncharacterized protein (TIGR03000 family)
MAAAAMLAVGMLAAGITVTAIMAVTAWADCSTALLSMVPRITMAVRRTTTTAMTACLYYGTPYYSADSYSLPATASLNVEVHVPVPDAKVWINGQLSSRTGTTRWFTVEQIYPDRPYRYEVRATWTEDGRPMSQTRVVTVQAGETGQVVFSKGGV